MRLVVALAIASACSAPPSGARFKASRPPPKLVVVESSHVTPPPPPIPTIHGKRDAVEAPHGGTIQAVALSPDGRVALSTDDLGGARLWMALDGSLEPNIVELPIAKALAVGTRPDGYSAVALDESGGLYFAKLDASGRTLSHVVLAGDPVFTGLAMTALGLVAWRADQTVALLDADGAAKDVVATHAGERIVAIATAGNRALAVLDRAGLPRRARWLKLEPKLDWGAWIDLDSELAGTIDVALSPNGARLALVSRTDRAAQATVFELAKGKAFATGAIAHANAEIGFIDEDHVAIGGFEAIAWLDLTAAKPAVSQPVATASPGTRVRAVLGTGSGHAVSATNGDLIIATPSGNQFLGYDMVAPRMAAVGPGGQLLVATNDALVWLDRELHLAPAPSLMIKNAASIIELRWLGDNDWLVEAGGSGAIELTLLDASKGSSAMLRSQIRETQVLNYEPSTKLATLSFGAMSEVVHFDRAARALDKVASIAKPSPYEQVLFVPVSPKLARGTQLIEISMRDKSTIKWLRDPRALDKPTATAVVDGPFAGADAAGNVYMWRPGANGQLELAVYADGKVLRTLPNTGPVSLWPEPAGARVVQASQSSVALLDGTGKQLWLQPLATAQEALWLSDGAIAITSAGGIARLDPATGAVAAARCGWKFGLSAKLHPAPARVEPLCAQIKH